MDSNMVSLVRWRFAIPHSISIGFRGEEEGGKPCITTLFAANYDLHASISEPLWAAWPSKTSTTR
jgi:hypothetical protein